MDLTMTSSKEKYLVSWDHHANNFSANFCDLLKQKELVDVTLAADGHLFSVHRLVLSSSSPYFRRMFAEMAVQQQAIVFMTDVSKQIIEDLITFIYCGEVNVEQDNLQDFFKTANALEIKGLNDGYNKFHSQTHQSNNVYRSQYQSMQTAQLNGSFATTRNDVQLTKYENQNQKDDKSKFNDYEDANAFDDDPFSMVDHSDDNFDLDTGTEVPMMDNKFNVLADNWNNDAEMDANKCQMETDASKVKRFKRNKDLSDYNIVADIRINGKGKANLFHKSFKFGKHSQLDSPVTRWTCTKHGKNKCRAVINTTVINGVHMMKVITAEHTHQPE